MLHYMHMLKLSKPCVYVYVCVVEACQFIVGATMYIYIYIYIRVCVCVHVSFSNP